MKCTTRHRRERRHTAALVQASGNETVLWCPACKGQILRKEGQITVTRLALMEVKHYLLDCPARSS